MSPHTRTALTRHTRLTTALAITVALAATAWTILGIADGRPASPAALAAGAAAWALLATATLTATLALGVWWRGGARARARHARPWAGPRPGLVESAANSVSLTGFLSVALVAVCAIATR